MPDNDIIKKAARARLRRGKSRGFTPRLRGGKTRGFNPRLREGKNKGFTPKLRSKSGRKLRRSFSTRNKASLGSQDVWGDKY